MSNLDKIGKSMSFFLDENFRPGLILHLNGNILYKNEPFKVHFDRKIRRTIDEVIDLSSLNAWTEFAAKAAESDRILMEILPMEILFKKKRKVDVQFFYYPDINKIVAFFDVLNPQKIPSLKTYLNIFKQSANFMLLVNREGEILDVNEMHTVYINRSRKELVGEHITKVFSLIDPENIEMLPSCLKQATEQGCVESVIKYQKSMEDTRFYRIITFYDEETDLFVIHMADATEKENLQVQLAHSGSLSAIGQIAASIAHEIRNPLTTLKGFTQLLKASATEDSIRYISVIEDEIDRMESILGEMLILSKPSKKRKSVFSLEVLVSDMVSILQPKAVMDGIEVIKSMELNKDPLIYGDPDKFKQVLLNLFKNALESMKTGGKLTIQISEREENLVLLVADTGKGMTRHQVNQVFMPFFSSKPGGTGLGLPFVLKAVEDHGGTISVESQVEVGTKFTLTFPWAHDEASRKTARKQSVI